MCKGSCRRKPTEGLFLQPFHHFVVPLPLHRGGEIRTPLGDASKSTACTCKSNPSRRGLQACFAYLQIPYTGEAHLAFSSGRFASARSALAGLAERREGGSRRLTDEVYFLQEKLRLSGSLCGVLIICADRIYKNKSRGDLFISVFVLHKIFRLRLCK